MVVALSPLWVLAVSGRAALSRRSVLRVAAALPLAPVHVAVSHAALTATLGFTSAVDGDLGELTIALEPTANAQAVRIFSELCAGKYAAPCDESSRNDGLFEKEKLEKARAVQGCITYESTPMTYDGSTVWRVVKGTRVDGGAMASVYNLRVPPDVQGDNDDGRLRHDAPGIVTMRRGTDAAGAFVVTTRAAPELDRDHVIVGRVVGGLDVLERLDGLPTVQSGKTVGYQALAGDIDGRAKPAKGCRYGSSELYCTAGKPLRKVTIRSRLQG